MVIVLSLGSVTQTILGAIKSTDGGQSWQVSTPSSGFTTIQAHTEVGGLRSLPKPSATVDATGRIYVAWPDCRFRSGCSANDIVMSTSTDGQNWSPVTRLPIDATSDSVDHFLAGLGADPTTGGSAAHLGLIYYYYPYSACGGTGMPACLVYSAFLSSTDGGASWSSHGSLNSTGMTPGSLAQTSRGRMLGDYFPVAWSAGKAIPVFPLSVPPSNGIYSESMSAAALSLPATAPPAISIAPSVFTAPQSGTSVAASSGNWAGQLPISYAYQWQRCNKSGTSCLPISGATSASYVPSSSDVGSTLRIAVTAQNSVGPATVTSAASQIVKGPPQNTAPPTVSGSAVQGQTLNAASGSWSGYPAPTFTYQWQDCDSAGANCSAISGATSASYTATAADAGSTLEVVVTATNGSGSAQASSAPTARVSGAPRNTAAPTVSGSAVQGQTLTASNGSWSGYPAPTFTYQWQDCDSSGANCSAISGATSASYTAAAADAGSTLEVVVTATNGSGSAQASSAPTAVVSAPPQNTAAPTVSGSAVQGETLTASNGSWSGYPAPTFTFQWQHCDSSGVNCSPISGATSSSYVVAAGDVGSTLQVTVTATNTAGSTPASSAPTAVVTAPTSAPQNTSAPTVSGSAVQGQTLMAADGSWSGSPAPTFTYQWQDCDSAGANCSAISGATSASYTATAADAGSTLEVVVTATNGSGSAQASSAPTAAVSAPPQNSAPPTISGSAAQGQTLTASNGSWSGYPSPTFSFQWQGCDSSGLICSPITGASSSSYTAGSGDAGTRLEVVVTATNGSGSAQASSAPTAVVSAPPQNTSAPTVSGSPVQGQTLTASNGSWSGYPSPTFAYQWQGCDSAGANCSAISGATSASYTASAADVGSTLEVVVTATNSSGSAQASSAPTAVVTAPTSAPQNTSAPTVSGSAVQGQTLTASNGSWSGSPSPTFTYQWQGCDSAGANCAAISGATSASYTASAADVGSTLEVVVTATNSSGSAQASSAPTAVVTAPTSAPQNTSAPTVSGSAVEGQTLTASNGSWSGSPSPTFTYQWQNCDSGGSNCAAITGATAASYVVVSADVGSTLKVVVRATNSSGSAQGSSAATAVVSSSPGPLTPLLDDFNRPNNSGPPGPSWSHMVVSSTASTNNLHITNQQITGYSNSNADYWNPQPFGPNSEVWITVATKPTADQDPVVLGLRFQNPDLATAGGYQIYYIKRTSPPDQYKMIARINGTTSTTLATANGPTLSAGDRLLFRAIGTSLELWRFTAGTWTQILTASDSTFNGAGYLILTSRNGAVRLDNFGGGTLP